MPGNQPSQTLNDLSSGTATGRILWLDAAKGVGIILVVLGHVLRGLASAGIPPLHWSILDRLIYGFHMPLFFLLSGFVAARLERLSAASFIRSRFFVLVWPYFLWSVLQIGAEAAAGSLVNSPVSFRDLSEIFVQPYGQFWFLYALLLTQLVVWLMRRRTLLVGISSLVLIILWPPAPIFAVAAIHLPFYFLGRLLAPGIRKWRAGPWLVLAVPCYMFLIFVSPLKVQPGGLPWYAQAVLGIIALIGLCLYLARSRLCGALSWVGTMSMSIYVMHVFAASGVRIVMMHSGVPYSPWTYAWAGLILGVALPIAVHLGLQKARLLPLFGLAPPITRQPGVPPADLAPAAK